MRFSLALLLCFSCLSGTAQSLSKFAVGGSIHAIATWAYNTSSSNAKANYFQTYAHYADSVSSLETWRGTFGVSVWGNYLLSRRWTLQGGLSYVDLGFQRRQENIQYMDPLFPGIGRGVLLEKSAGGGTKVIEYNYSYQYLQVPLLVNYNVYSSRDFRYFGYISGGLGLNMLLDHHIRADLYQFVVDGERTFILDSTGYEGNRFAFSAFLGVKGEYRIDKRLTFFLQPVAGFSPVSASRTPIKSYPIYFQLNVGLQYAVDFLDDRGR